MRISRRAFHGLMVAGVLAASAVCLDAQSEKSDVEPVFDVVGGPERFNQNKFMAARCPERSSNRRLLCAGLHESGYDLHRYERLAACAGRLPAGLVHQFQ